MLSAYLSSIAVRHYEHRSWKIIWYQSFQSKSFFLPLLLFIIHFLKPEFLFFVIPNYF